jgi:serine/threonine-protein kinase ATR
MLQAQQIDRRYSFMESAKLVKATGEPLRALQELENSMRLLGLIEEMPNVIDLTDDDESKAMKGKVHISFIWHMSIPDVLCRLRF